VKRLFLLCGAIVFGAGQYVIADEATKARLDTCVSYYKDGDYQKAADSIKALLPLIADRREEAEAYKYLGFSYVMLDLIEKAKDFFRVALEKFPKMVIDTLEVPPNITIVFRQAKLETQLEKGEIGNQKMSEDNQKRKRTVFASLLTATGGIGTIAGGYFLYKGIQAWHNYKNIDTTYVSEHPGYKDDLNRYWSDKNKDFIIAGCATGVAAVTLYFGLRLFFKKTVPQPSPQKVGVHVEGNSIVLYMRF
jgi:tetratricopeptide (TPR) repeat protein